MAQVAHADHPRVGHVRAKLPRRDVPPPRRPPRGRTERRGGASGRNAPARRIGAPVTRGDFGLRPVLARRACQLQKHVVERRPAEPEIAHPDVRLAERRGGILDHLKSIPRRRERQLREPLPRLRLTAPYPRQRRPSLVPFRRAHQLDLSGSAHRPDPSSSLPVPCAITRPWSITAICSAS